MINLLRCAAAAAVALFSSAHAAEPAPALLFKSAPGEQIDAETRASFNEFLSSLTPLKGEVDLNRANATLSVPSTHYFLARDDARAVLENAWGNPPDTEVLGMIFPAGVSPLDTNAWGAAVYYVSDGYVSDDDADAIDYEKMMEELMAAQTDDNKWRQRNGYQPIHMIGWAEWPSYDASTHKLYWAKEMRFGEDDFHTLNYDIRVLGRRGALMISFIAQMNQLSEIRASAPAVLEMASFNAGSTYAEYKPGQDKVAAYGIAGLVGGAAIAKKSGFLAAILLFGKKFIVFIVAGLVAAFGALRRFMTGRA